MPRPILGIGRFGAKKLALARTWTEMPIRLAYICTSIGRVANQFELALFEDMDKLAMPICQYARIGILVE